MRAIRNGKVLEKVPRKATGLRMISKIAGLPESTSLHPFHNFIIYFLGFVVMKNLLAVLSIALTSTFVAAPVQASTIGQSVCEYVAADDKSRLRSFLKTNKLKIRNIYDGLECNGANLLAFASDKNAVKTGSLIISKLPKKTVEAHLASIKSAELSAAAQKRVNG